MSRLIYPGMRQEERKSVWVPPVRIVHHTENVKDAERLCGKLETQAYLHFDPEYCTIPAGESVIFDFGKELHGAFSLTSVSMKAIQVRITLGESVSETLQTPTTDHAVHQTTVQLPMLGQFSFGDSAFRFVRLEVPEGEPELHLLCAAVRAIYRDWDYAGFFRSSDERLNRIWQTSAYTVHLNCQEYIYDGVKRDRLVWMGDLYPEVRTMLAVFNEYDLIEKSMDFLRTRKQPDQFMNGTPSYSCWWIICLHALYLHRNNRKWLEEQKDELDHLLRQLCRYVDAAGREDLPPWRFLDWSTEAMPEVKHAGLQGLLAWTLKTGSSLADELALNSTAALCRETAERVRQIVPDCRGNKIAAAMQTLGLGVDHNTIFRQDPHKGISTFYGYFVLLARAETGDLNGALDLIRTYWGGMLDAGATTFWEDFETDWLDGSFGIDSMPVAGKKDIHADFGKYCYKGLRHSLCHGWAGGPAAFLSEKVLGVTPIEPGFRKVQVKPDLGGLDHICGAVPTPYGLITVEADEKGQKITLPDGVTMA